MTERDFTTLAFRTSPKTSKITTFQDELQAAVSFRKSKVKAHHYDDINDEDFFSELLKTRKKKIDAFKAGKSKVTFNTFEVSDDEEQYRPKKVSFLKTQRFSSNSKERTGSESEENVPSESPHGGSTTRDGSFSSPHFTNSSEEHKEVHQSISEPADLQATEDFSSLSNQTSGDALPASLLSDSRMVETAGPSEPEKPSETSKLSHFDDTDRGTEVEPPKPKPRLRTLGLKPLVSETSQDISNPQTSSVSIPISTDASSTIVWTDGDHTVSGSTSKSASTSRSEESRLHTGSTFQSGCGEPVRKYSSSFEEFLEPHGSPSAKLSTTPEKSFEIRAPSSHSKSTQRSQSASCYSHVESKYLGSLKIMDSQMSLQQSSAQAAATIRAAVYQEWLKKKKETSKQNMQLKKKEEFLKEKQKKEQETKKEDALASYEAWKVKKAASLKEKARERREIIQKQQKETEEKQEKKQSAKQVFEKWKQQQDQLLREKYRKQKEAENKEKVQKVEEERERKKDSKSAYSDWCEKKKYVLHKKLKKERKESKNKAEEEQYMKEERDKMALEMYENWLIRKDSEQKRKQEERLIHEILRDSPPPPWSPPNKTVPFGK